MQKRIKKKLKRKKIGRSKFRIRYKQLKKLVLLLLFLGMLFFIAYLFYLNQKIQSQFSSSRWSLPSKIYADNLILYTGLNFSLTDLEKELKFSSYRKDKLASTQGSFSQHGQSLLISIRSFYLASGEYQKAQKIKVYFKGKHIRLIKQAKNNYFLDQVVLDPLLIAHFGVKRAEDRRLVSNKQIPKLLVKAIVATEDHRFYSHFGVDPIAILRALYVNLRSGKRLQGGSTITQQLVKNYFLSSKKDFTRKINEALMAMLLEYHYSKQQIITAYINQVYLGQDRQRAIHGFALAAEYYFQRRLQQLSLPQIATLVGLVKGASYYNPRKHQQRAKKRRNLVLKLMQNKGDISKQQYRLASKAVLGIGHFSSQSQSKFPAFTQLLKKQLLSSFSSTQLQQNGLKIYSSIKPWLQRKAEKKLHLAVLNLQKKQGKSPVLQSAMLISDTENALIIALIGDKQAVKLSKSNFNRAIDSRRNIGSLVKPAIYLTALASGYSVDTKIDDSPIKVKLADHSFWYPKNFSHKSHGLVSISEALSHSYNIASVRLGLSIGLAKVLQTLKLLGVEQQLPIYPSVLLGALSLSPYEVNQIYQTLANRGVYQKLSSLKGVLDKNNNQLFTSKNKKYAHFSSIDVQHLTTILQRVVAEGTAKKLKKIYKHHGLLAAKTGTTNDNRDSWFVAYNDQYVATVWLGNDRNKSIKFTGSTGAMLIWARVMNDLLL